MNIIRRLASFLLVLTLVLTYAPAVFATDISDSKMTDAKISWDYTVYDKDGNVINTGTLPNANTRYSWSGITLKNDEAVLFTPSNNKKGLYCEKGKQMKISYKLNRTASHRTYVSGYATGGSDSHEGSWSGQTYYYTAPNSDNYYGFMRNLSSDPITVKSYSITF